MLKHVSLICLLFCDCTKADPAKDKEIAELKTQLARCESAPKPSLAAVDKPATPALTRPKAIEELMPTSLQAQVGRLIRETPTESAGECADGAEYEAGLAFGAPYDGCAVLDFATRAKKRPFVWDAKVYGQAIYQTGGVLEMKKAGDRQYLARISFGYGGDIWVQGLGDPPRKVDGSGVVVYGYGAAPYTYSTTTGAERTIPSIAAVAMLNLGGLAKLKKSCKCNPDTAVQPTTPSK